jgi:three-Cys-motif partner protein
VPAPAAFAPNAVRARAAADSYVPIQKFGGGWTEQKLRILNDYLTAYCRIFQVNPLANYFDTIYVDAFAGTGLIEQRKTSAQSKNLFAEFTERETIEFLSGSASRALQHPFARYVFIEKAASRIAELEKLRWDSPQKSRILIQKGDANTHLVGLVNSTDWNKCRAVVFLDPYGMQVDWKTIERLGRTKAVDLWLLFPLGQAVMRLLRKQGDPPAEWQQALDRIFGTHEWHSRFYVTTREPDFFEKEIVSTHRVADWQAVGLFMMERLKTVFHSVALNPGVLLNSRNVPL